MKPSLQSWHWQSVRLWRHVGIWQLRKEELEDTTCFMLAAFGAGLQGEEVPLLLVEGLLTFWTVSREAKDRHIMLALKGCFKGEVDKRRHLVLVSDFTQSGLPFRLWMERALHRQVHLQN
jgi:hypothetical protein